MSTMDAKAYGEHMRNLVSSAVVTMALVVGKRSGLLSVLCSAEGPMDKKEIADKANCKERYVQEWLGCMATAHIVQYDKSNEKFFIPEDHRASLMDWAGFAMGAAVIAHGHDNLLKCFSKEGPMGYNQEHNPKYFPWIDELRNSQVSKFMHEEILPSLAETGILDILDTGGVAADIGCGAGNFSIFLAKKFPKSRFEGFEYSRVAIERANMHVKADGIKNVQFKVGDAMNMPRDLTNKFDWVFMYDVLHDLADPWKALTEMYEILKPKGVFTLLEMNSHTNLADNIGDPQAAFYYSMSMHTCLPSSMSAEPHTGFGACWGFEECEKCLETSKFTLKSRIVTKNGKKIIYTMTK